MYRQGDVLFRETDHARLTTGVRTEEVEDGVVAEGEATGHAHRVQAPGRVIRADRVLHVDVPEGETAEVTHEEHDPITLPAGIYEVIQQREYDGESRSRSRRVLD